jgi:hypothetical protein
MARSLRSGGVRDHYPLVKQAYREVTEQAGQLAIEPRTISTLRPSISAMPATKVRRTSSVQEVMTCRPPTIVKAATYTSTALITGTGMIEKAAANFGQKASAIANQPAGIAINRLAGRMPSISSTSANRQFWRTNCIRSSRRSKSWEQVQRRNRPSFHLV